MSENPYTNMDARDLFAQAQRLGEMIDFCGQHEIEAQGQDLLNMLFETDDLSGPAAMSHVRAMLLRAAQHLQSMDEKIARHIDGQFVDGVGYAERAARARSNVLPSPGRRITNEDGEMLIASFVSQGRQVKKFKPGETTPKAPEVIEVDVKKTAPARTGFKLGDL